MEQIFLALGSIFSPDVLLVLSLGVLLGLIVGAIPGLNDTITLAVLVPVTFSMNPLYAFALLVGVYCAACYGGSIPAILLKIPGTASSVVTTIDGYAMANKGEAGLALGISTISSVAGGVISAIVLVFFAPTLAKYALHFGPPEYFALAVLGLSTVAGMSGKHLLKNLIVCVIGLLISTIGMSPQTGFPRFTMDFLLLYDGIPLVPMLIGLFGISSVLHMVERMSAEATEAKHVLPITIGKTLPSLKMLLALTPTILLGSAIGTIIGIIPGAGMLMAIYLAYDLTRIRYSKLEFGKGEPHGVAAPESANNAVVAGSMVPLLALGIPGNSTSALFLGALMIQGLRPGPALFTEHPDVAYFIVVAFLIANLLMLPMGLAFGRIIAKIIFKISHVLLSGTIILLCITGAYAVGLDPSYIWVAVIFGALGYIMDKTHLPQAPLVLAMVLGPVMEIGFEQSLVKSKGSMMIFFQSSISLAMLGIAALFMLAPLYTPIIAKMRNKLDK
ncbi:tripartite tricarboxylate transporter permease [Desulfovibrio litoralis]|uniref:Putative tricarboxylic transport membrane protein n=1 Tax=Desulfovibrio litoralis DSM 11393 TaxID=1121455 RepID=A0A1M7SGP3_9BACT|nr:tripartite tricarboxylate transporter permease [Desulfovibrio litoralis]SHN57653.1 putative tricarboxylic transport membrane protein [Desulfovibrio litoralis DSM 11393]